MVIAETVAAAKDGAERVAVDYEPLSCVTLYGRRRKAGAPLVRDEHSSNVCIDAQVGDATATEAAFRPRQHVVKIKTWVPRVGRFADGAARADRQLRSRKPPLHGLHLQWCDAVACARTSPPSSTCRE